MIIGPLDLTGLSPCGNQRELPSGFAKAEPYFAQMFEKALTLDEQQSNELGATGDGLNANFDSGLQVAYDYDYSLVAP
jgi:hypothetical protein